MVIKENCLDYEIYTTLRSLVAWENYEANFVKRGLEQSYYSLVAFEEETPVAMARLVGDGIYLVISDVVVIPEYQKKGIGSELIRRLTEYVAGQVPPGGRTSLQLLAAVGKEPFYEKMGFRKLPHENCGAGFRKVIDRSKE